MLGYEVTVRLHDPGRGPDFEHWMRQHHIPAVLATGCFTGADFGRADSGAYRTRYLARSREDLDRYLRDHAQGLRHEFTAEFGHAAAVARDVWEVLEGWSAS
jgi:hypothetical protein